MVWDFRRRGLLSVRDEVGQKGCGNGETKGGMVHDQGKEQE